MKPLAIALFLSLCTATALAQGVGDYQGKRQALMMGLYPPDLLMRQQQRLGISSAQRTRISEAVQQFQADVTELQWTLQNEQQLLKQMLSGHPLDDEAALTQAEKVLTLETQFKTAHMRMLIAIKNQLTAEQVDMIDTALQQKRQEWNNRRRQDNQPGA